MMRGLFAIIVSIICVVPASQVVASQDSSLLQTQQKLQQSIHTIPQWDRVVRSYQYSLSTPSYGRTAKWNDFIQTLQDEGSVRQILKVNLWFNGYPYKQDNWIYGKDDHWATPSEFLDHGGDCEDFVIIKYFTLRQLGFPADSMKMTMVYDVFSGTDHALLIVTHNNETYVLDNRENMTIEDHYIERYQPYYAFNENHVWTYPRPTIVKTLRMPEDMSILPGNR